MEKNIATNVAVNIQKIYVWFDTDAFGLPDSHDIFLVLWCKYPSIYYLYHLSVRVAEKPDFGREMWYTLGR